jgi:hypothetical protein
MQIDPFLIIFVIAVAVFMVGKIYFDKKRREAMELLASKLGLQFNKSRDYKLADRHRFLDKLAVGSNRYAYNVMEGDYQGHPVALFDYHCETTSGYGKDRKTNHHHFSFFVLSMEAAFPELTIADEGIFSKISQALGHDDIDFESHEFSGRYVVRCENKKFAYDVCNARMIEYLLVNPCDGIEIENGSLAIGFNSKLGVDQIEAQLKRLLNIRTLMPNYLFSK